MENNAGSRFTLEQLAQLSKVVPRTIRFYIQMGLVRRPNGTCRGAWYDAEHLETLLRIRRLSEKGLSLEAVRRALVPESTESAAAQKHDAPTITTRTHMNIADGLEIVLDPLRAPLSPEAMRRFVAAVTQAYRCAEKFDSECNSSKEK